MLSLCRNASTQYSRPLIRTFAQVVPPSTNSNTHKQNAGRSRKRRAASASKQVEDINPFEKVEVREDHGLYAFFRRKANSENSVGEDRYDTVESPEAGQLITGRAWEASELRNKSFLDLHTLWYIALREKNLLATQKEEARRLGVTHSDLQVPIAKVRDCRKTMARIKLVLNERRLAYEGARKLAEQEAVMDLHKEVGNSFDEADRSILKWQQRQQQQKVSSTGEASSSTGLQADPSTP